MGRASRSTYKARRSKSPGCWRNPFIVFLISFVALGSLRFRVPARSKQAAANLLLQRKIRKQQNRMNKSNKNEKDHPGIRYVLQEEGKSSGRSFQKYRAFITTTTSTTTSASRAAGSEQEAQAVSVLEWAETVSLADSKAPAIAELNSLIAKAPHQAIFFETPPVTSETAKTTTFEFVLVDAPDLHTAAVEPSSDTFALALQKSQHANEFAAVFGNLKNDATLIAPKKLVPDAKSYVHLAKFVRDSKNPEQVAGIWKLAAEAYLSKLLQQEEPSKQIWFSTSGMGVYWLHFRLDETPKYYTYDPYKKMKKQ